MAEKNIHEGHRRRMLETYLRTGLAGFSDVEVLEFVLTFAIPRKDTNPIAHALIDRFQKLHTVMETPMEILCQTPGVTPRAAVLLHLLPELWGRYASSGIDYHQPRNSTELMGEILVPKFRGTRDETVWLLCLDARCRVLDSKQICTGSVNSVNLPIRKIVETALAVNASMVVLAHNHISGIAIPSNEDIETTERLKTTLAAVDVVLADHLIVANDDYVSMRESGLIWNR